MPNDEIHGTRSRQCNDNTYGRKDFPLISWSCQLTAQQGVYGDKEAAIARFKENYSTKLSDEMKARLVLENDEVSSGSSPCTFKVFDVVTQMCYSADDLLPVCEELGIPLVVRSPL